MVPLNKSIRKLKPICRFIALLILLNGKIPYPRWNSPITIDDMLIGPTLHSNGEAPVAIPTTFKNTKFPSVAEKIKNLVTSREEALAAHELARSRMAERIRSNFVPFKKGQMVWLDSRHLKTNYHKKMAPKQEGPFEIEEVLEPVTYQLKLPVTTSNYMLYRACTRVRY
jgi:hypothetical protein